MVKALLLHILISALAITAVAQPFPPPQLKNEGTAAGPYHSLNCVGPAVNCTNSSAQATMTIDVEAGDISNLSASDTQVLYKDGTGISGDADMTWNETTNTLDLGTGLLEAGYLGLAGTGASTAAAINIGNITSADMISPILANITYTGTSTVVAALQSEMNHTGSAVSPTVWGVKAAARAGSNNFGINSYVGIQADATYNSSSETCGAFEYCVFYGIDAVVLGEPGGSHDATSTNIAIGVYVPAFGAVSGGTFIRHGILMGEPLSLTAGTRVGYDAGVFNNSTTVQYYDSGTSELRTEVGGTEIMSVKATAIGFFNTNPVARPSAYTQTYSTASRTMPNLTSSSVSATAKKEDGSAWCFTTDTELNNLITAVNALRTDVDNGKKVTNQLIDDLQSFGLLQ